MLYKIITEESTQSYKELFLKVWLVLGKVVNRPIYIFTEINNSFKSKMEGTNLDQILAQNRFFRRKNWL